MLYWLKHKILELPLITKIISSLSITGATCLYIFKDEYIFCNLWNNIYETQIVTNPFFPMLFMSGIYFSLYIPYALLDVSHFIKEFKIQKNHYPNKKEIYKSLILWLKSQILIDVPFTSLVYLMNISTEITKDPPKLGVFVCDILISFLLMDCLFYVVHRLLHTNWLYKNIHKIHHEFKSPFVLVGQALHPIEHLLFALVSVIPIYLTSHHLFTQHIIMIMVMMNNIDAHCGYKIINFYKWSNGFLSGSTSHDLHHERFIVNYSIYTTIWDRIFKTHSTS